MFSNTRASKRCAQKLPISPAVYIPAKQRKEGKTVVLWRHWEDMEMKVMTNHLGVDRCKKVLFHAQTWQLQFKGWVAEWAPHINRVNKPSWEASKKPRPAHGQSKRGYAFLWVILSHWTSLKSLRKIYGEAGSWIQVSVFSGQHFNHKPILFFVEPLSYYLFMTSTVSHLILPGSCILHCCKHLWGIFCALKTNTKSPNQNNKKTPTKGNKKLRDEQRVSWCFVLMFSNRQDIPLGAGMAVGCI